MMYKIRTTMTVMAALALASCSLLKPVHTQNFVGDVHLRSLEVDFTDIGIVDDDSSDNVFSSIKRVQKLIQEIGTVFDEEESQAISQQMVAFQETLIGRLRERSGLPLVLVPDPVPKMKYASSAELEKIVFEYPETQGATLDLDAKVTYHRVESIKASALDDSLGTRRLKVKPRLAVTMKGLNQDDDLFWRDIFTYQSDNWYAFSNDYLLGVSNDDIQDAEIFLLPLARGI